MKLIRLVLAALHVAATYKTYYMINIDHYICLGGLMVSVFALQSPILDRCIPDTFLSLFFIYLFFFFLYQECILYHIRAFCVCYQCNIELFCLFVLRFSVPVNIFMSYRAEPPPPGY